MKKIISAIKIKWQNYKLSKGLIDTRIHILDFCSKYHIDSHDCKLVLGFNPRKNRAYYRNQNNGLCVHILDDVFNRRVVKNINALMKDGQDTLIDLSDMETK